jgi:hypothetical protein
MAAAQVPVKDQPQEDGKRILGIIPNFRTTPSLTDFKPLTISEKFTVASQDTFDRGTFVLAGIFAGEGQFTNQNRSFGQGIAGFGRYYSAAYANLAIGNYMTEAIFPSLLHEDPRYFRKGTQSGWSRLVYAIKQIFVTHTDSNRAQFNYSEFAGNSVAVAISNVYYEDNRTAEDAVSQLGLSVGVDMFTNVLEEFWPDLEGRLHRKSKVQQAHE